MNKVISLGGSVIVPDSINSLFLAQFREIVLSCIKKNNEDHQSGKKRNIKNSITLVCGGGKTAREYVNAIKNIVALSDEELDVIGIEATRMNALLVKTLFKEQAYEKIVTNPNENIVTRKQIIVAGGWKPGFSTDMDAVLLAKKQSAKEILNISNISYVYDKDPRTNKNAKPFTRLRWNEFFKLIGTTWKPCMNTPFDPVASREAQKRGLSVHILGADTKNIQRCLEGKSFTGTVISDNDLFMDDEKTPSQQ